MLYDQKPDLNALGTLHLCLEVLDIERAVAQLQERKDRTVSTAAPPR